MNLPRAAAPASSAASEAAPARGRHWSHRILSNGLYRGLSGALTKRRQGGRLWLLVAPPVAWLVFLNVLPLLQIFRISFFHRYPVPDPTQQGLTLDHYRALLTAPEIYVPFLRTLGFSLWIAAASFVFMYPIAFFLAKRVQGRWQLRLLVLIILPAWVSEIIRVFSYVLVFASNGLVNLILQGTGLTERPVPFLYTWTALSAGALYIGCLFMLVPLFSAIEKIPTHLLESARDLGAGSLRIMLRLVIPLSRDGIATGFTFVFLITVGLYTVPSLLAGSDNNLFAQTIGIYFHESDLTWSKGAALSIALFCVALAISGLANYLIRPNRFF